VLDEAIRQAADRLQSSVIVMPTRGHDSVGDVLVGSHTEHVIRNCNRPVLVVPRALHERFLAFHRPE
jgi:nucleotide-binding universal stress UspA family protein